MFLGEFQGSSILWERLHKQEAVAEAHREQSHKNIGWVVNSSPVPKFADAVVCCATEIFEPSQHQAGRFYLQQRTNNSHDSF